MFKQYLQFILIMVCFPFSLHSQSYTQWTKGPDLPVRLSEIKAITCNDKIYVIGGKISNDNTELSDNQDVDYNFEYDPLNKTWSKKANMPTRRYDVALAVVENKIYALSTKNEVYDPVTDTWQVLTPMPGGMAHLEAVTLNKKIYVLGSDEGSFNKNMMYDPLTDRWSEMAAMPTARLAPCVIAFDDKIYVLGGLGFNEKHQLGKLLQTIEVYDPGNDSWEVKSNMPDSLWGAEGIIVKNNRIILINVRSCKNKSENNIFAYNPVDEKWEAVSNNLPKCFSEQGITLLHNMIYVIAGHDEFFKQYNDVYIGEF